MVIRITMLACSVFTLAAQQSVGTRLAGDPKSIYDSLGAVSDWDAVLQETSRSMLRAEVAADSVFLAWMVLARGRALMQTGDLKGADVEFDRALSLAGEIPLTAVTFRAYFFKSNVALAQGHMDTAREISERRLALAIRLRDKVAEGWARTHLAYLDLESGRPDSSHAQYLRALSITNKYGPQQLEADQWLGLGRAYGALAAIDSARVCYQRALGIARDIRYGMGEAHAINNLGVLEFGFGDLAVAARCFDRGAELAASSGDWTTWTRHTVNRADALMYLGHYRDADSLLEEARQVCERHDLQFELANVLTQRASLELEQGRYGAAAKGFRATWPLARSLESAFAAETCAVGLARALCGMDSLRAAIEWIESSRRLMSDGSTLRQLSLVAAEAYRREGDPKRALANAADVGRGLGQHLSSELVSAIGESARALVALGQTDSAAVTALRAIDAFERRRRALSQEDWREALGSAVTARLMDCAWLLRSYPTTASPSTRAGTVFEALERLKTRTLIDRLCARRRNTAFSRGFDEAVSLAQLQSDILRDGELLLETFAGWDSAYVVAVTKSSVKMQALSSKQLARAVRLYNSSLTDPGPSSADSLRRAQRVTLRRMLFDNAADLMITADRLIMAPDGEMAELALATLATADEATLLIDRFELSTVPSATILAGLRQTSRQTDLSYGTSVTVLADIARTDITGPAKEARLLAKKYKDVAVIADLIEQDVGSLALLLDKSQVIHLAAHVEINTERPWQSGVRLDRDRIVRAGDVAAIPLEARLAVLSGCESAGGRLMRGEGVLGLTSAFLAAGVPCVVATLWPVDDRVTVDVMDSFYDFLADGRTVAAALRDAQKITRQRESTRHPFFWAAFVVIGDGNITAELPRRRHWPLWPWVLPLFVVLAIIGARRMRKLL